MLYRALQGKNYTMEERGSIEIKGKGLMTTYFLTSSIHKQLEDASSSLELDAPTMEQKPIAALKPESEPGKAIVKDASVTPMDKVTTTSIKNGVKNGDSPVSEAIKQVTLEDRVKDTASDRPSSGKKKHPLRSTTCSIS